MAIAHDGEPPSLVLDAGTGLQRLSRELGGQPFRGTILLGHLHWDHTHGLPFFAAGDHPDAEVDARHPAAGRPGRSARGHARALHVAARTSRSRRRSCGASGSSCALEPGEPRFEGFDVLRAGDPAQGRPHVRLPGERRRRARSPTCPTTARSRSATGPTASAPTTTAALELARGVDVLVHDAQHTAEEFAIKRDWGHSAIDYAIGLGVEAGVGKVVLFHHDPPRTDDQLDAIVAAHADDARRGHRRQRGPPPRRLEPLEALRSDPRVPRQLAQRRCLRADLAA